MRRIFISYSHDNEEHSKRVNALARRLRRDGVNVVIDRDMLPGGPPDGWPLWSEAQVRNADVVLVVCTETYTRRYNGEEVPELGHGSISEARIVRQLLYNTGGYNEKFRVILFSAEDNNHVATQLEGYHRFLLYQPEAYAALLAWLSGKRSVEPPAEEKAPSIVWPVRDAKYAWPLADRKSEFALFQEMIAGQSGCRILLLRGPSNTGKTVCIAELLAYTQHLNVTGTLLDFKGCPLLDDLFGTLRFDLGPGILLSAYAAHGTARFFHLMSDLQQLAKPLLLVFDTYEQASADAQNWLESQLLPRLDRAPGVIVVIGGQQVPDPARYRPIGFAELHDLKPIQNVADWREMITKKWQNSTLQDAHIEGILAATEGDPGKTYATLESLARQRHDLNRRLP